MGTGTELRKDKRRPTKTGKSSLFAGVSCCADCKSKPYCRTSNYLESRQDYFVCSDANMGKDVCGSKHYIRAAVLQKGVLAHLQDVIGYIACFKPQFRAATGAKHKSGMRKELAVKKKLPAKAGNRIKELDRLFLCIYEDKTKGNSSESRFQMLSDSYEKEQEELRVQIEKPAAEIAETEEQSDHLERFIAKVHKYFDLQELTPEISNDMVKRVYVHAPQTVDGKRTQEPDICYDLVGILPKSLCKRNKETKRCGFTTDGHCSVFLFQSKTAAHPCSSSFVKRHTRRTCSAAGALTAARWRCRFLGQKRLQRTGI